MIKHEFHDANDIEVSNGAAKQTAASETGAGKPTMGTAGANASSPKDTAKNRTSHTTPDKHIAKPAGAAEKKGGKSVLDQAVADMAKQRQTMCNIQTKVSWAVESIENGSEQWKWADNDQNLGELKKKRAALQQKLRDSGLDVLMHATVQQLKKDHEPASLVSLCSAFKACKTELEDLEKFYNNLWRKTGA